jgi:hypothetical protein
MGFTIASYQLYGLPISAPIYVSIHGSYSVKKAPAVITVPIDGLYNITFTTYFSASKDDPVITQKDMSFNIQALPNPVDLYKSIYEQVKLVLDPKYGTPQQTLEFTDDILDISITTDPITTDPITTDPTTTDPITTDPITTDPITTDPITTDPITTDPTTLN